MERTGLFSIVLLHTREKNLNQLLLPGPTLSSSLMGVLLRFREYSIAVSSDIKGMFHQVRLLPEYKSLLRFLWRELKTEEPPSIYTWQVLPFGTTCSPCCATFALQKHVFDHSQPGEDVRVSIEKSFYVDNCLQSLSSVDEARHLVNKLTSLLATGGFELRQWASNTPDVSATYQEKPGPKAVSYGSVRQVLIRKSSPWDSAGSAIQTP